MSKVKLIKNQKLYFFIIFILLIGYNSWKFGLLIAIVMVGSIFLILDPRIELLDTKNIFYIAMVKKCEANASSPSKLKNPSQCH